MSKIKKIIAREILDSRGNPTIETKIILENCVSAAASVPSGTSTGEYEAFELRDGDQSRYGGKGVLKAVKNVNKKIDKLLKGKNVLKQQEIDSKLIELDGTKNKKKIGANAILSVSLAIARAGAIHKKQELYEYISSTYKLKKKFKMPTPCFNIFNGGKHADTNLDFQEFMIIPMKQKTFAEKVRMGAEIFHSLGLILRKGGYDTDVGNEGGYAPDILSSVQAIEFIVASIADAGYEPGIDAGLGIDVGSSELYDKEKKQYIFKLDRAHFSKNDIIGLYYEWFRKFPIISIEDGLEQNDWEGWRELTKELGEEMLIIGDDLFVTNIDRLRIGLKENTANSILIKLNQIGTLSETIECVKLAQKHNYNIMVSHRSGETCDDFISDLAVAINADYIKAGSLSRGERLAKYNRLMEIEELIKSKL